MYIDTILVCFSPGARVSPEPTLEDGPASHRRNFLNAVNSSSTTWSSIGVPELPHTPDLPPHYDNLSPVTTHHPQDQLHQLHTSTGHPPVNRYRVTSVPQTTTLSNNNEDEMVAPPTYESLYPVDGDDDSTKSVTGSRPSAHLP